jgi:hypothetical protein
MLKLEDCLVQHQIDDRDRAPHGPQSGSVGFSVEITYKGSF